MCGLVFLAALRFGAYGKWMYIRYEHVMFNKLTGELLSLDGIPSNVRGYPSPSGKYMMFALRDDDKSSYGQIVGCFNAETSGVFPYNGEELRVMDIHWEHDDFFYESRGYVDHEIKMTWFEFIQ